MHIFGTVKTPKKPEANDGKANVSNQFGERARSITNNNNSEDERVEEKDATFTSIVAKSEKYKLLVMVGFRIITEPTCEKFSHFHSVERVPLRNGIELGILYEPLKTYPI